MRIGPLSVLWALLLQDLEPVPGQAPNGDQVLLLAEPVARANSFVGTEEYLAPEVGEGQGLFFMLAVVDTGPCVCVCYTSTSATSRPVKCSRQQVLCRMSCRTWYACSGSF